MFDLPLYIFSGIVLFISARDSSANDTNANRITEHKDKQHKQEHSESANLR